MGEGDYSPALSGLLFCERERHITESICVSGKYFEGIFLTRSKRAKKKTPAKPVSK